jgi:Rapamycin-insensitive companion of mTOR, N-term
MSLASKSIVNIMRNWNGVIYMTSSPLGLESLINSLTQPIHMYKKLAILDTFVDIFNIPIYIASTDISSFGSSSSVCLSSNIVNFNENLLNNYVGLLL